MGKQDDRATKDINPCGLVFRVLEATNHGFSEGIVKAQNGIITLYYELPETKEREKFLELDLRTKRLEFYTAPKSHAAQEQSRHMAQELKQAGYQVDDKLIRSSSFKENEISLY